MCLLLWPASGRSRMRIEYRLQFLAGGNGLRITRITTNWLLLEWCVGEIKHLSIVSKFKPLIADIGLPAKLDINPFALRTSFAADLRGEAVTVKRHAFRQYGSGQ